MGRVDVLMVASLASMPSKYDPICAILASFGFTPALARTAVAFVRSSLADLIRVEAAIARD